MNRFAKIVVAFLALSFFDASLAVADPAPITPSGLIRLFDGQTLTNLYPWFSAVGFGDPNQSFHVENGLLHVTGNGFGALTTMERYRNYVMIFEFKWGTQTWQPRQGNAKDAGVLFHSNGVEGGWNGLLMPSIEAQIMEGSMGDIILLKGSDGNGGTVPMSVVAKVGQVPNIGSTWNYRGGYRWDPVGTARTFNQNEESIHWSDWDSSWTDDLGFRGQTDFESPDGQWNQMAIVAENDRAEIYFNGFKVNEITNVIPTEGKLQLESEYAEYFVRRWELRPLGTKLGAVITTDILAPGTVDVAYYQFVRAAGGVSPLNWSIVSNSLPTGLSLNSATGEIEGTPTVAGAVDFTIQVADNAGEIATQAFQLVISTPGELITNGLVLRLESDFSVEKSGNIVSGWQDQSGAGNKLVSSGTPHYDLVQTPSGLPAISLNGSGDRLQRINATSPLTGLPTGNANRTMFVVAKYNGANAWAGVAYGTGADNQAFGLIVQQGTGKLVLHGWGGGNDLISSADGIGAGWLVQSAVVNGGTAIHYKDGAQIGQFVHTYNTVLSRLVVGEETAGIGYVAMDVAAILIYNRALDATEQVSTERFLEGKYLHTANPDLKLRTEVAGGEILLHYPALKPIGEYYLHAVTNLATQVLSNPSNRIHTITKSEIEAMDPTNRNNMTFEYHAKPSGEFFQLFLETIP